MCGVALAHTINWYADNQIISTTTCQSGDSITPPTAPAKYGYTFAGWGDGYTFLEYIESTGTQYIDTGIVLNNLTAKITTDFSFMTATATDKPQTVWGFIGSSQMPRWGLSKIKESAIPAYLASLNSTNTVGTINTNRHIAVQYIQTTDYASIPYLKLDADNPVPCGTPHEFSKYTNNTISAFIFGRNNGGFVDNFVDCRIYRITFEQNGHIIGNFIPARRGSDSAIGMYDTVTKTFFKNAGTGEFIAGPEVGS